MSLRRKYAATRPSAAPTIADSCAGVTDIVLERVNSNSWRVCNSLAPIGDTSRLLGFVEERGEFFEVLQLGQSFKWSSFPSLKEALVFVKSSAESSLSDRLSGELAWVR